VKRRGTTAGFLWGTGDKRTGSGISMVKGTNTVQQCEIEKSPRGVSLLHSCLLGSYHAFFPPTLISAETNSYLHRPVIITAHFQILEEHFGP